MKKKIWIFVYSVVVTGIFLSVTNSCSKEDDYSASLAEITTSNVTSIKFNTAISGGNITDDRGFTITQRGICWGLKDNPTTDDSTSNDGAGSGSYVSSLIQLISDTTYYVRAYAINSQGTSYGSVMVFNTPARPVLTTNDATSVSFTTAVCGGNITDDGDNAITSRGVCWCSYSTSLPLLFRLPTIDDSKTIDGSGIGSFTSNLTGLTPGTNYYVRSYAINSKGVTYGGNQSFKTLIKLVPIDPLDPLTPVIPVTPVTPVYP